jgi:hypothetical protein
MPDASALSAALAAAADDAHARARLGQIRPLRGVRGVPNGALARIIDAAWKEGPTRLPYDAPVLRALFGQAWEDGIVAIALAAGALPDAPDVALELGLGWLSLVDDAETADALGLALIGPGLLATGARLPAAALAVAAGGAPGADGDDDDDDDFGDDDDDDGSGREAPDPRRGGWGIWARRAVLSAGLAGLPVPLEGPVAAALRARLGMTHVAFVAEPQEAFVAGVLRAFVRDEAPPVRKALLRTWRAWASVDPEAAVSLLDAIPGGVSKVIRADVEGAARKALARARRAGAADAR